MHFLSRSFLYGTGFAVALSLAAPAQADLVKCHKTVVNQLVRFKKKHLSLHIRCIDKQNVGKITGPCPDTVSVDKLDTLAARIDTKIATDCTMGELTTLGFASDCELEPATTGIEGDCADLPVTNPTELSQCLRCWKGAELSEFIATLYASHSLEVCGGDLSESSPVCSDLDCTTPLPDQRDLGDTGENDCQRAVAKAGFKYLVNREKTLEK
jgi:hypothetical protein